MDKRIALFYQTRPVRFNKKKKKYGLACYSVPKKLESYNAIIIIYPKNKKC